MPVDAISGDIERAVLEPAYVKIVKPEGRVLDDGERSDPVQVTALLAPEAVRVRDGIEIPAFIFLGVDVAAPPPFLGHRDHDFGHGVSSAAPAILAARSSRDKRLWLVF